MTEDEFIIQVDRALSLLGSAFRSVGMEPPTAVLLGSIDDAERLRALRPSMSMLRGVDENWANGTICRIHGVDFRRDFYRTN